MSLLSEIDEEFSKLKPFGPQPKAKTVERQKDGVYHFKDAKGKVVAVAGENFMRSLEREFSRQEQAGFLRKLQRLARR